MSKNLTAQQIKDQIRASIKRDNERGIWVNFWYFLDYNTWTC